MNDENPIPEKLVTITEREYLKLKYRSQPNRPRYQPVDYIEGEIWKYIPDTNHLYLISNLGRLRRQYITKVGFEKDYLLSNPKRTSGCTAKLHIDRYTRIHTYIHTLVLKTFDPLPEGVKLSVIHLDCDLENNKLDNLKWGTHSEAIIYKKNCGLIKPKLKTKEYISKAGKKKVKPVWYNEIDLEKMRQLKAEGLAQAQIAEIFGCSQTYVSKVVNFQLRNDF